MNFELSQNREKNPMNSSAAPSNFEINDSLQIRYAEQRVHYESLLSSYDDLLNESKNTTERLTALQLELLTTLTFNRMYKKRIEELKSEKENLGRILIIRLNNI